VVFESSGGAMAEFFEVPVLREDGSEGLHFVNVEAVSYVDLDTEGGTVKTDRVRIYLNNGYWFTLSGPKAKEVLNMIKNLAFISFKQDQAQN
jgi:hypothetical protein